MTTSVGTVIERSRALAGGLADARYVGQIDDQTAIDTVDMQLTTIIDRPSH